MAPAVVEWDGGAGTTDWNDAANWTGDTLPGPGDDVLIGAAYQGLTITSAVSQTVGSVSSAAALSLTGGTFQANGGLSVTAPQRLWLLGGTLRNTTVAADTMVQGTSGTLDGVTLMGDLAMDRTDVNSTLNVRNGLTLHGTARLGNATRFGVLRFWGPQTLAGSGTIVFGANGNNGLYASNITTAATITLASGITVRGHSGTLLANSADGSFVNRGTIRADVAGGRISVQTGADVPFVNTGALAATNGGTLQLSNRWTSSSGLEVTDASRIELNGNVVAVPLRAAGGGTIVVTGANNSGRVVTWTAEAGSTIDYREVNNTGGTLTLAGEGTFAHPSGTMMNAGGRVLHTGTGRFNVGDIIGGTVEAAELWGPGTLDGVTVRGNLRLDRSDAPFTLVKIRNGLTLDGTAYLGGANSFGVLDFDGQQTFAGAATVVFGPSLSNGIYLSRTIGTGPSTLTLAETVVVRGHSGTFLANRADAGLTNEGTIRADGTGGEIRLQLGSSGSFINRGNLVAVNGGTLSLSQFGEHVLGGAVRAIGANSLVDLKRNYGFLDGATAFADQGGAINFGQFVTGDQAVTLLGGGGTYRLWGGTAEMPLRIEVASQDRGNTPEGYTNNLALASLRVLGGYTQLVDARHTTGSNGAEALYVGAVDVLGGATTFDLNGLPAYARSVLVSGGTVTGGTLAERPDGGALPFNSRTPGGLWNTNEVDEWTFFGRTGQVVAVTVEPGRSGSPAPLEPILNWAAVQVLAPDGSVVASGASATAGATVLFNPLTLPADGTYRLRVQAPADQPLLSGNYLVGVWNAPVHERPLVLDQSHLGVFGSAFEKHRWSFTATMNTQVRFRLLAASTAALRFALRGPDGFVGFVDLAGDSALINLPSAGTYTVESTTVGETGAYSFRLESTAITDLSPGTPTTVAWPGNGIARLFRVRVPAGQQLLVRLTDPAVGNRNELYARHGAPPTRETFDAVAIGPSSSQQLLVPSAMPGDWYLLAYGTEVPELSTVTLRAEVTPVLLLEVTPARHGNASDARLRLTGGGFLPGTTAQLVGENGAVYTLADVRIDSPTGLSAVVVAATVPAGVYGVRVTRLDGSVTVLPAAYTVLEGGRAELKTNLIVPDPVGFHQPATIYVEYSNVGDLAMPAPLLLLTATQREVPGALLTLDGKRLSTGLWTAGQPDGFSESVQILAGGASPGLLLPGETIRVPVYYAGWRSDRWDFTRPPIVFRLGVLEADNTTPIDWAAMKPGLRPATVSSDAWDGVYTNLTAQLGSTWGDYVRRLGQMAQALHQAGETTTDPGELWLAEVLQANATGPLSSLGASSDASTPTTGLELSFVRAFTPSLTGRHRLGRLGRGWSDNWDLSMVIEADGTVVIVGPAGSQRRFQPDRRPGGRYFAQAGDVGVLRGLVSGGFQLDEADGTVLIFLADGRLDQVRDPSGNRITAGYTNGMLTSLTHSAGSALTFTYNAVGRLATVTDPVGRTTTYTYDVSGEHLLSVTAFDNRTTRFTYDAGDPLRNHALRSIGYPDGTTLYLQYDARGRIVRTERDGGAEGVNLVYDGTGGVTLTDAAGGQTRLLYNPSGLLLRRIDPLGRAVSLGYDDNSNLTRITDETGQSTINRYDDRGNLISTTDPLGQTTSFTYRDTVNRLASVTDAKGNTTQYLYDNRYNLEATVYADGTVERLARDPLGEVIGSTNRRGVTISYTRDSTGRLTGKTYQDGSQVTYTYDPRGNLINATDSTGTTLLSYDTFDRLTRITYPSGRNLDYTYDSAGRRIRMIDQDGVAVQYEYNATGKLGRLADGSGATVVAYTYDSAGRLTRQENGNGTYSTYEYDLAGQLVHLVHHAPNDTVNSRFDYTYDRLGRRVTMATLDGHWDYSYDATGQLVQAIFISTNPAISNRNEQYEYDAVGNRVRTIINGVTTEYASNRVNGYTREGNVVYTSDADGNATARIDPAGTTTLTYDDEDRLVAVSAAGRSWLYQYDAFGNRVAVTFNGQRTEYVIDPAGLGNVVGEYGPGGSVVRYSHGLGLVSRTDSNGTHYYDFDALGSTVGLTNSSGNYANYYAYSPFGETLSATRTVANPFAFVGQFGVMTESNNLHYMRARYYFAPTGRFINQDPIGIAGGINVYAYVANRPTQLIDPSGLLLELPTKPFTPIPGPSPFIPPEEIPPPPPDTPVNPPIRIDPFWAGVGRFIKVGGVIITGLSIGWDIGHLLGLDKLPNPVADSIGTEIGKFIDGTPWLRDLLWGPRPEVEGYTGPYFRITETYIRDAVWWSQNGSTTAVTSTDPNDKHGPAGYQGFVAADSLLTYRINFENHPDAAAPAQLVTITDPLDTRLDLDSFTLDSFGFGDIVVQVPPGRQHFQTTIDLTIGGRPLQVQVELWLDRLARQMVALFQTIDPATQLPPDVLSGFLPPEDGTGRGQGYVSFSIRPQADLPTGTTLRNVALITFDANPPISTDQIDPLDATKGIDPTKQAKNILDAAAPTSTAASIPAWMTLPTFVVSWSGADDPGGSGIAGYDVFVATDDGPFTRWLAGVTSTSATFTGAIGHRYAFYSIATDHVGHVQPTPAHAQAGTFFAGSALSLRKNGDFLELVAEVNGTVLQRQSVTDSTPMVISGDAGNTRLTIDFSGGPFALPVGSRFDGGAGTDRIVARYDGNLLATANALIVGRFRLEFSGVEQVELTGGSGRNVLDASAFRGTAILNGGPGNDVLRGGRGNDILTGGPGNDMIVGNGGIDTLVETADANMKLTTSRFYGGRALGVDELRAVERATLTGGARANVLDASAFTRGPVTLDGGAGNDLLLGGWGNDILIGGFGADRMVGGRGVDTVRAFGGGSFVLTARALTQASSTDLLTGVEAAELTGGNGDDRFSVSGWFGRAVLIGGGGADRVVLRRGGNLTLNDAALWVSATNRFTLSGIEQATLIGGIGNDRFTVSGWTGTASLDGGGGIDTVLAVGDSNFTLTDSSLIRSIGGVILLMRVERAMLLGGPGDNVMDATGFTRGGVVLVGGPGADRLLGGSKRDLLIGGSGADILNAGNGDDLLIGGSTQFDNSPVAMDALLAEWGRTDVSYARRIRHLKGEVMGGLNRRFTLTPRTVSNDDSADTLTGDLGVDWFLATLIDGITDRHTGGIETWTEL